MKTLVLSLILLFVQIYELYPQAECDCVYDNSTLTIYDHPEYLIEYVIGTCTVQGLTIQTVKVNKITIKNQYVGSKVTSSMSINSKVKHVLRNFAFRNPLSIILGSYNYATSKWGISYGGCWSSQQFATNEITVVEELIKCDELCCVDFFNHYLSECNEPVLDNFYSFSDKEDCSDLSCIKVCGGLYD